VDVGDVYQVCPCVDNLVRGVRLVRHISTEHRPLRYKLAERCSSRRLKLVYHSYWHASGSRICDQSV